VAEIIDPRTVILLYKGSMAFAFLGSLFFFLFPAAYAKVNMVLMRELGFRKKIIPWLETERKTLDVLVLKRKGVFSFLLIIVSFVLLTSIR
jgi:hypothetical protein